MPTQKLPASQRLARWTDEADRIFNHILGYVIAFTSLVAFADVLGNGKITQALPLLFWIWVIAQGLCVEFQVFILIRRLPRLWKVNRWMFTGNIAFILCLCLMSVFIGSVFVQHDNAGGTIEQAMSSLGINHTVFIYARSSLAILLVVLIAVDRALDHQEFTEQQEHVSILNSFEVKVHEISEQMNAMIQSEQLARQALMQSITERATEGHLEDINRSFAQQVEVMEQTGYAARGELLAAVEHQLQVIVQQTQDTQSELLATVKREMVNTTHHVAQILSEHRERERVNTPTVHPTNITTIQTPLFQRSWRQQSVHAVMRVNSVTPF
jgi:hypothetical protein